MNTDTPLHRTVIQINAQRGRSMIVVADLVRKRLERLAETFPPDWRDVLRAEAKALHLVLTDLSSVERQPYSALLREAQPFVPRDGGALDPSLAARIAKLLADETAG